MPPVDLDALLAPVSAASPCGANLEYGDPAFAALERAAQGKPEQQIGATIIPAEEPDWKAVGRQATVLLGRTKDLRIAVHLAKALLNTEGLQGFADGLTLLSKLVETNWDGLHPVLDPEDDNDPTMRLNIFATLTAPAVLAAVRAAPVVSSRTMGRFSLKDIESAAGEPAGDGNGAARASAATIDATAMDSDLAALQATTAAARACAAALDSLERSLAARLDAGAAPNLAPLAAPLRKIVGFLDGVLARRMPAAAADAETSAGNGAAASSAGGAAVGEIRSREDVIRALDKIAAYYKKHEPSSPVPLFMERCKRLVMMSFMDIVRELVPDAISQVEVLKGRTE